MERVINRVLCMSRDGDHQNSRDVRFTRAIVEYSLIKQNNASVTNTVYIFNQKH